MNSDAQNNAHQSAATSDKEPTCEIAFLNEQAADAKAALASAGEDLCRSLGAVMSPRMWVKEHPWAFIGVPAASLGSLGALLGFFLLRKKKKRRSGGIFSRLFSSAPEPDPKPMRKRPWWLFILEQAFALAQPAVLSAIASIVGSRFVHDGNGHAAPRSDGGHVR